MRLSHLLAAALLLGVVTAPVPASADDPAPAEKPMPLDDETRVRWMAHIIKGFIGLAARGEVPGDDYLYCVSGLTADAAQTVAAAVRKIKDEPEDERPWPKPTFIAQPNYRPSAYPEECTGGYFLFGAIGADPIGTINVHRHKQRAAVSDLPPTATSHSPKASVEFFLNGKPDPKFSEERKREYDHYYAEGMSLDTDLEKMAGINPADCQGRARPITLYMELLPKHPYPPVGAIPAMMKQYAMACLSVENDTLHIALNQRMPSLKMSN